MKLIVLDRDGVINRDSESYIKSPDEWQPIPGSLDAIARMTAAGYRVVVATNQSGIARGLFDLATLGAIHSKMHQVVAQAGGHIDAIFFCPHAADEHCDCRKPKPGMLLDIASRYAIAPTALTVIGDSMRDLQSAAAAGATPWLVLTGNGSKTFEIGNLPAGTVVHDTLATAVDQLLRGSGH